MPRPGGLQPGPGPQRPRPGPGSQASRRPACLPRPCQPTPGSQSRPPRRRARPRAGRCRPRPRALKTTYLSTTTPTSSRTADHRSPKPPALLAGQCRKTNCLSEVPQVSGGAVAILSRKSPPLWIPAGGISGVACRGRHGPDTSGKRSGEAAADKATAQRQRFWQPIPLLAGGLSAGTRQGGDDDVVAVVVGV